MVVRWGIVGPGRIARNFADGLKEAPSGVLAAIASRDAERRQAFGDAYGLVGAKRYATYEALFADGEIDAVYIATPHPFHGQWAIAALRSGKHVLCEKPCGMNTVQVIAMTEVADQEKKFFMEAVMYRCHPQIARMLALIEDGVIGEVRRIEANFGFEAPFDPQSRLFDRALGGGAILDVGVYPVSFARLVAGAAIGKPFDDPISVKGQGRLGDSHVDEEAHAVLKFESGIVAECETATRKALDNHATVIGRKGKITLTDPWVPGKNGGPSDTVIEITKSGGLFGKDEVAEEKIQATEHLFAFEAELASRAIQEAKLEATSPAMSWQDSIGNAETLDCWRYEIGYDYTSGDVSINRALPKVVPPSLPKVPKKSIEGVSLPVSSLVMGCDNRDRFDEGAVIWDAWMEAGGNAFDTAFVYGQGRNEAVLGEWIAARGVAKGVVVIAKGAHTPHCEPDVIATQLTASLDRLGLDHVPIYIMHRDNPKVAVGEFIDALNDLKKAGRIGIFGGSNWSVERFDEANDYAARHGLEPMRILNNNLSLAVMERPVWPGCVTSNAPETLTYLRDKGVVHLSWSSQARGYFLPASLRDRLPEATRPEACFGSSANEERRRRAESLAEEKGVTPHNIATAWVLAQGFPSIALIGPRSPGEIVSTLPALGVELTPDEAAWLNLELETR